jgi:exopolyphosphatase / guanosine-5'-triphosphate,3'-diphosphate pyrophosphatase
VRPVVDGRATAAPAEPQGRPDLDFPLRAASVDIGSNAIRMLAAEFADPGHWISLESRRAPVRLGHSAFLTGRLDPAKIDMALEALLGFREIMGSLGIREHRVVATSAVRESRNRGDLVERACEEAGFRIETISGSEEARLVWLAIRNRIDLPGRWLMVDLGGGSLEVSVASRNGVEWTESHAVGTVRLLEELDSGRENGSGGLARLVDQYLGGMRLPHLGGEVAGLIATGGNIEELAQLAGAVPEANGAVHLPVEALKETNRQLAKMSFDTRVHDFGLREDRADVIIPAGRIYQRLATLARAEMILVPNLGVKEGVLLDLVEDRTRHQIHVTRQERDVLAGSVALGRRYRFDEAHGRHVATLAVSLFDQLREIHGLGDTDRRILLGAAVLHDIGQYVSYRKHHRHSLYLILNSDLAVFSPDEMPLVALTARYHRRSEPQPHHEVWCDRTGPERSRVERLAALLRIADALDRKHAQEVSAVRVFSSRGQLSIRASAASDLALEDWVLEKKARPWFEETFGRKLVLLPAPPEPV